MRTEGTLTKWNDDRGFGFITPSPAGSDIFVHVSAFPKDGRRPTLGERLSFEIETDNAGRKRAKNVLCPGRPVARPTTRPLPAYRAKRASFLGRILPVAVLGVLAVYGYNKYALRLEPTSNIVAAPNNQFATAAFRCDGRTRCAQMTSCEEAAYFLRNCPDTEMDGDGDGIPCERQWCN
jgi:cold shock CspA family protein